MRNSSMLWIGVIVVLFFCFVILTTTYEYRDFEENNRYCESMGYDYIVTIRACYKENDEYNNEQNRYTYKKIPKKERDDVS